MAGKNTFNIKGIAEIQFQNAEQEVKKLNTQLAKLGLSDSVQKDIDSLFSNMESKLENFQKINTSGLTNPEDVKALNRAANEYTKALDEVVDRVKKISTTEINLGPSKNLDTISNLKSQLDSFKTRAEETARAAVTMFDVFKKSTGLSNQSIGFSAKDFEEAAAAGENMDAKMEALQKAALNRIATESAAYKAERKAQAEATNELGAAVEKLNQKTEEYGETPNRGQASWLTRYKKAVDEMKVAKEEADKVLVEKVSQDPKYQEALDQLTNMRSLLKSIETEANSMDLGNGLKGGLEDVFNMIIKLEQEDLDNLVAALNATQAAAKGAKEATGGLVDGVEDTTEAAKKAGEAAKDLQNLQNTLSNFFSLTNTWNLVKSAAKNAWSTVKELDAAMTEIAVVTDMSLKQVWSMRDEYSSLATDMGAATIDMVNASKLYYQQGLSQAEVTAAATETIKMARIASLDGATATNLMTAAVRGFNMEMTDAAMINDTYSWLAAKSAADTHEIADAMTRTASIAHAAGASFQNTAVFLTQMIETTREAPENLGTALKTIIARFTEMKKAPNEIGLIEGEVVDANKLETALKSVGIALRDNVTGEFRDFDKVIMDISSKWNTMSQLQQRYVATTAAGSRQQSRFIALVQNHQRLTELSEGAANSAGAATEQFNKTMDSLDSKVNKLQNAMKLFWTNLFDSTIIKVAVDTITQIVESFNRLIEILPQGASSVAALALSFGTLQVGRSIIDGIFKALGGDGIKKIKAASGGFKELFSTVFTSSKGVTKEVLETKEAVQKAAEASGVGTKAIIKNLADQIKYNRLAKASTGEVAAAYKATAGVAEGAMMAQMAVMGKVILIVGAVVVAIAAIHAVWKHFDTKKKRTTYEYQLESLKESAKQAAETAEETKAAYDELLEGVSEYTSARDSLDNLTEGTKEWQDQLVKTNDTVLELIANVPTLAAGLRIGSDGSLIIDPAYVDAEVEKKERDARFSGTTAAVYNRDVFVKEQEGVARGVVEAFANLLPDDSAYAEDIKKNVMKEADPELADDILKIVQEYQDSELSNNDKVIAMWGRLAEVNPNFTNYIDYYDQPRRDLEYSHVEAAEESFTALTTASSEYQEGLETYTEGLEGYSNRIALANLDPELQNTKAGAVIAQLVAGTQDSPSSDVVHLESSSEIRDYMMESLGLGWESVSQDLNSGIMLENDILTNLQTIYANIADISVDDIPEKIKDDADGLRAAIQTLPETLKFDEASQKLQNSFLELDKEAQESFTSLLNPEEWIVGSDVEDGKEKLRQIYGAANDAELSDKIGLDIDKIDFYLEELSSKTAEAFRTMLENSKLLLGKTGSKQLEELVRGSGIDSATASLFGRQMQEFAFKNGSDAAETLMTNLTNTISKSSVSKDAAKSITKAFAEADISTPEGLDEFAFLLKEIAPSIPEHETDDFIEQLKLLGNVIEDVDVEGLREKFQKNLDIADRLNVDDPSPEFSKDDVTTIREALMGTSQEGMLKDFIKNADGSYTFIGESIDDLKDAIIESSEGYVKAVSDGFQRQIDLGEAAQKYTDKNDKVAVGASNEEMSQYIVGFLGSLSKSDKALASSELGVNAGITAEQLAGSRTPEQLLELQAKIDELAFEVDLAKAEQEAAILETKAQTLALQSKHELMRGARNSDDPEVVKRHNEALLSQAVSAGVAEDAVNELRKAMLEKDKALAGGTEQAIENAEANEDAARVALVAAMEYERMAEAMEGAGAYFQENLDIIQDTNQSAEDQAVAYGNLAARMTDITGIPLPPSFFDSKENLELLQDAINGGDEAWYKLLLNTWNTEEGQRTLAEQFGITADDITRTINFLNGLDLSIEGQIDVTDIMNGLKNSYDSVEDVARALEILSGKKVSFEMGYREVDMFAGFTNYEGVQARTSGKRAQMEAAHANGGGKPLTPIYKKVKIPTELKGTLHNTGGTYSGTAWSPPTSKALGSYKSPDSNPKNQKAAKSPSAAKDKAAKKEKDEAEKEVEIWENGYDRLYNLVQKTNAEIRTRNKLERDYGRHLTDNSKTYKDMIKNVQAQRASLQSQQKMYQDQRSGRINEIGIAQAEHSDVKKYASLNATTGVIQIDWAAIDKNTDVDRGARIEAYISELERIAGELESITDSSEEIIDQLEALRELGKDSYLDLERRVYDALLAREQEQLDALTDLDATITNSSNTIANRISEAIAEERAARAEDRALESIQEKERRLALLRSDTSGANQLDILALEEQLMTDRENFTDSLIDKAISTMQQNADEASKQRQFQIEVAQAQYEHDVANGVYWQEARDILTAHAAANSTFEGSPLSKLLGKYEDIKGMSTLGRSDWYDETKRAVKEGFAWYELEGKQAEAAQKKIDDAAKAKAKAEADKKAATSASKTPAPAPSPSKPAATPSAPPPTVGGFVNAGSAKIWSYPNQSSLNQYYGKDPKYRVLKEMGDWLQVRYHKLNSGVTGWFKKNDVKAYKEGGLADYTGPAWVDGTKKKPEAFLDAHDTQNFMTLRDLLSDALKGGAFAESTNSGSIFNIDVKVDSISNDYDVKKMVKVMKKELGQEARYRNVNSINIGMR